MDEAQLHSEVEGVKRDVREASGHGRRWRIDSAILVLLLIVNLIGVGYSIEHSHQAAERREQLAREAVERQDERLKQSIQVGACIVELLFIDPPERSMRDVGAVCPESVHEAVLEMRHERGKDSSAPTRNEADKREADKSEESL